MSFLTAVFGTQNERNLRAMAKVVAEVNLWEPKVKPLTDEQITARAKEIAAQIRAAARNIEDQKEAAEALFAAEREFLPEVFALTRECSVRTLGMRPFDMQIIGGIALWEGEIAEMKTGEGKTLAATMPLTLHAMAGRGTHLVTVNDYLARRDAEWMGPIYEMMGLTVGLVVHDEEPDKRKSQYYMDITYGTNNEFGFDYLRDNMAMDATRIVQRDHYFAIVDEADSILIDEARTPLIISGPVRDDVRHLARVRDVVRRFEQGKHYELDEKHRSVTLTDAGVTAAEQALSIENLYDDEQGELLLRIENMARAYALYHRDRDYIVKGREVILIDEHTGRQLPGRRLSDGMHQAIEVKENVPPRAENQTRATISLQNYFRMYHRLAGMTGTADSEAVEFEKTYNLGVMVIPPNMPMVRDDEPNMVYLTADEKLAGIYLDIFDCYVRGQPVLVGTASVEMNELVSDILNNVRKNKRAREVLDREIILRAYDRVNEKYNLELDPKTFKIPHTVLNAKVHAAEAEVVAQGGRLKAVTIATNMAGRGTDIKLGGDPEMLVYTEDKLSKKASRKQFERMVAIRAAQSAEEKKKVVEFGGLRVIGTERHESRRIDNQLRGRSGRQGDPGSSCFYLSFEDDVLRIFGGTMFESLMARLQLEKDEPIIRHRLVDRAIERAQKTVEGHNFDIRKRLVEYDDVMNQQRELIYKIRHHILLEGDVHNQVVDMAREVGGSLAISYTGDLGRPESWDIAGLARVLNRRCGLGKIWDELDFTPRSPEDLAKVLPGRAADGGGELAPKKVDDLRRRLRQHAQKEDAQVDNLEPIARELDEIRGRVIREFLEKELEDISRIITSQNPAVNLEQLKQELKEQHARLEHEYAEEAGQERRGYLQAEELEEELDEIRRGLVLNPLAEELQTVRANLVVRYLWARLVEVGCRLILDDLATKLEERRNENTEQEDLAPLTNIREAVIGYFNRWGSEFNEHSAEIDDGARLFAETRRAVLEHLAATLAEICFRLIRDDLAAELRGQRPTDNADQKSAALLRLERLLIDRLQHLAAELAAALVNLPAEFRPEVFDKNTRLVADRLEQVVRELRSRRAFLGWNFTQLDELRRKVLEQWEARRDEIRKSLELDQTGERPTEPRRSRWVSLKEDDLEQIRHRLLLDHLVAELDESRQSIKPVDLAEQVADQMAETLARRFARIQRLHEDFIRRKIERNADNPRQLALEMIPDVAFYYAYRHAPQLVESSNWDYDGLIRALGERYGAELQFNENIRLTLKRGQLALFIQKELDRIYRAAPEEIEPRLQEDWNLAVDELKRRIVADTERQLYLQATDMHWMRHLWQMDHLRDSVGFVGYAQKNPLLEYKTEGSKMFDEMIWNIRKMTINRLCRLQYYSNRGWVIPPTIEDFAANAKEVKDGPQSFRELAAQYKAATEEVEISHKTETVRYDKPKLGRNDPCHCGSGKKYKHCCWDKDHKAG